MRNSTAVYLTVAGGVFYVIGGALVFSLAGALSGFGNLSSLYGNCGGLCPSTATTSIDTSGLNDIVYAIGGFGILAGVLMIVGGVLMGSDQPNRRKAGGILAVIMLVLGSLPALGGLLIGFILAAIGCYMGLTYKASRSNFTMGFGPVGSVTLGPQSPANPSAGAPPEAGRGPLNYCIKCGSRLRDGAVFCGACGARVPE
ncbi:MAG: zinc ribbon domain-containing protein [Thaumarchaeota archaeon]|nr:zinc ribbon domain-containing protein [Nitrososphaerota archaeon]